MTSFVTLPVTKTDGNLIDDGIYNDQLVSNLLALLYMTAGGVSLWTGGGSKEIGYPIGTILTIARVTDISNIWLRCDGRTIGNTSSGATARANADMLTLYTHIWDNTSNTDIVIQNSSGVGTTRGASATADFNANKRLPLFDMRGRVVIGEDDPTGSSAANRVTDAAADRLGGTGGSATHTLTIAEMPSHSHTSLFYGSNNFLTGGSTGTGGAGAAFAYDAIGNTGGGGAHANVQPYIAMNQFIYAGN
ncbi:MAG: hypothetical protein SFZ02_19120 [bacterium]|nr:hypothetical protein [bacterium]